MSKICSKELTPEQDIDIVKWVFRSGSGALSIENAVHSAYFHQNFKMKVPNNRNSPEVIIVAERR